ADNHSAGGRRNANERQPRILVRSGAPYANVGVLDWLLGKRIVTNERVPRPHLVQQVWAEGMNVLDRHHSVVVDLVVAEARNVWSGTAEAGQGQRLRRVGKKELHCEKVALTHAPVQVRIELILLEDRWRG